MHAPLSHRSATTAVDLPGRSATRLPYRDPTTAAATRTDDTTAQDTPQRAVGAKPALRASVDRALAGQGASLQAPLRRDFEQRFGHDFSQVRIHAGASAQRSAHELHAAAYTFGNHIVFGAGRYAPATLAGQQLLAHELAHVVQQSHGGRSARRLLSRTDDAAELQADEFSQRAMCGAAAVRGATIAPAAQLSLAPETWYRGEAEGVSITSGSKVGGHDLGDGMYLTDDVGVAREYADTRVEANKLPQSARRILSADIDLSTLRVLDLTKDKRFEEFRQRPAYPGATLTHGDLMKTQQNYPKLFDAFCKENKINLDDYQVIIGPETVRGGKQLCIRDPKLIAEVRSAFVSAKPPGGRGGPGSGSGSGSDSEGPSKAPASRKAPSVAPTDEPDARTPSRAGPAPPVEEEPQSGRPGRRPAGGLSEGPGDLGPSPRRVVGTLLLNLGSGVALGLFQSWFKGKVQRDLNALPKPRIDRRGARDFLNDPDSAGGAHLLDLFNKNLKPFQKELQDDHQNRIASLNLQLMLLALKQDKTSKDVEERLGELDAIDDELGDYDEALATVADNLDAILAKEADALAAGKSADDLRELLKNGAVVDWLFHQGFSVEEIAGMDSNLAFLSASITMLFDDTRDTLALIERLRARADTLRRASKKIWWDEFGKQVQQSIRQLEARRAQQQTQARQQRAAATPVPQPEPSDEPVFRNSDEMGDYYGLRTRESELLYELRQLEQQTPADPNALFAEREALLQELAGVRVKLRRYAPRGLAPNESLRR